jgi:hypothetical protein
MSVPASLPALASRRSERVPAPAIGKARASSKHTDSQVTEVEIDLGEGSSSGRTKHSGDFEGAKNYRISTTSKNIDVGPKLDPEEYQNARKKLKKAVLEHYR